ncbi:MAG TPA: alpha/beta hydrolase [Nevskiaceae bacterium]|nr:alpha/beta hydrolase [Nevskiaceae bacterium]
MTSAPLILMTVLTLLLSACTRHLGAPAAPPPARPAQPWTVERDLGFTPAGWPQALQADLYRPLGEGPHPAVLLIHGGGWERGDREQVQGIAWRLAEAGYLVMNTTYRFAPAHRFPAQLEDVQAAVRWLRSPAGRERGVDPARIAAFGYSAGAHLAALLGATPAVAGLGDPATAVQAVVAGGTPSDLTKYGGGTLVPQLIGGPRRSHIEQFRRASPVFHVTPAHPPTFLYHGGLDTLVGPDHAQDYYDLLRQNGVEAELFLLRGRGHITAFLTDGPAVRAAIAFLDRQLR